MSTRKGITLPNREWDRYTEEEVKAIEDLEPETLVWLLYGTSIDFEHQKQLNLFITKHPNTTVIYRPYADNIPKWDPKLWANECCRRVSRMDFHWTAEVICDNERNLAVEHGNEDWVAHVIWLRAWAQQWRDLTRNSIVSHLGALSPSGNYQIGMRYYKDSGVYKLFDVADAHVYGNPRTVALPPTTQPICVTEFNQWTIVDAFGCFNESPVNITDAVYFILGGTKDQEKYDLLKLPGSYASFKRYSSSSSTGGQPVPMSNIPAEYSSPNHGNHRPRTTGIVLHATLSGKNITLQQEYESTCNYFNNPAPEGDPNKAVSAHAVVHLDQIHHPVYEDDIAWHCLTWNGEKLGIEATKNLPGVAIPIATLDTVAKQCAKWCIKYNIPTEWSAVWGIEEHRNMPNNNHQDVGTPFDRDDFMKRVKYYVANLKGAAPVVNGTGNAMDPATKKVVLDDLDFLWAYSSATQTSRNPQEAEKVMRERIVGLKTALGLNN